MPQSDLPYVLSKTGPVRSDPVFPVELVDWTDLSGIIAAPNEAFEIMAAVDESVTSRFIAHVGEGGSIWINFLGGEAAANGPGSIELRSGSIFPVPTRAAVSALGTVTNLPYTAAQG